MRSLPNPDRILGIRIRLHYTWPIVSILLVILVVTQFPEAYPLWQRISLGIIASLIFFIAVSIREFIILFIAIRKGIPVKSVTLFVFGGVTQIPKEANRPTLELLVAVVGLLSNLAIAGMFYMVHLVLVFAGNVMIAGLIQWLAFIYFMLFLFHFIPGFPLDGGRLLRTLLWVTTGDYDRATHITGWVGRGIGLLSIVGGILAMILAHQWFIGLLLLFFGWPLENAAAQSHQQTVLRKALLNITAGDVMTRDYPLITQHLSIGQLVRDYILVTGRRYFVVVDDVKLQGVVTMRNIKSIPKERWDSTPIGKIMTPASELKTALPEQAAVSLLEQMDELRISQMPVLEKNKVTGIITRDSLIHLVKTRAKLRM